MRSRLSARGEVYGQGVPLGQSAMALRATEQQDGVPSSGQGARALRATEQQDGNSSPFSNLFHAELQPLVRKLRKMAVLKAMVLLVLLRFLLSFIVMVLT